MKLWLGLVWTCLIVIMIAIVDTVHASPDSDSAEAERAALEEERRIIEILEDGAEDDSDNGLGENGDG
jgi:hypothetical protein